MWAVKKIWLGISEQRHLSSGSKDKSWYLKGDSMVRVYPERFTYPEVSVYISEGNKTQDHGDIPGIVNWQMLGFLPEIFIYIPKDQNSRSLSSLPKENLFTLRRKVFTFSGAEGTQLLFCL